MCILFNTSSGFDPENSDGYAKMPVYRRGTVVLRNASHHDQPTATKPNVREVGCVVL